MKTSTARTGVLKAGKKNKENLEKNYMIFI